MDNTTSSYTDSPYWIDDNTTNTSEHLDDSQWILEYIRNLMHKKPKEKRRCFKEKNENGKIQIKQT